MTSPDQNLVDSAAALGRRDVALTPYALNFDTSLVVARIREDEHIEARDLESHLPFPREPRGAAVLHDPGDFTNYALRLGDVDATTVWADLGKGRVTAVFDDHRTPMSAGWRRHTATLDLQPDPDWATWIRGDGNWFSQTEFAEHLEQLLHTVASPPAADLYEVSTSLQATRNVTFKSGVRLNTGDTELTYDETTKASAGKQKMEIPPEFTVRIAPFAYTDPIQVVAKLRYRIVEGTLRLGYVLIQPHIARQDAFAGIVGKLRADLVHPGGERPLPVFLGVAPERLR